MATLLLTVSSLAVVLGVTSTPASATDCSPSGYSGSTVAQSTVLARANAWVSRNVPYTQNCASEPEGNYRQDCSGFIAMAWELASSPVTTQFNPAYNGGNPLYQTITRSALVPGDALVTDSSNNPGDNGEHHIAMFTGWSASDNGQHRYANLAQESDFGVGTIASDDQDLAAGYWSAFTPIHYTQMTGSAGGSPAKPTTPGVARFANGAWTFYLYNRTSGAGVTDEYVTWPGTLASDVPLFGDWTGTGKDTPGLARFAGGTWTFYLYNYTSGTGVTDEYVTWSGTLASDVPLVGDWTGAGKDTPGLARFGGSAWTFYLYNYTSGAGVTDEYVTWSGTMSSDRPLVGDWTGAGKDTPGLARFGGSAWTFYLYNYTSGAGVTDEYVTWSSALASDRPLVGDWTGAGKDTPGLARFGGSAWTFYMYNYTSGAGVTDEYVTWSSTLASDTPGVGSWI